MTARGCGVVLLLATAGALAQPVAPAPRGAFAAFTSGDARVQRGGDAPQSLARGESLHAGDLVVTGPAGRAQLVLADGSRVALQADSRVSLGHGAPPALGFGAGSVRVLPAAHGAEFQLRTTRGAVRVRGAGFSATNNPDDSVSVASEREPVEVCTAAGCVMAGDDNVRVRAEDLPPTRTNARARWR